MPAVKLIFRLELEKIIYSVTACRLKIRPDFTKGEDRIYPRLFSLLNSFLQCSALSVTSDALLDSRETPMGLLFIFNHAESFLSKQM